jgi:hypothetical protein
MELMVGALTDTLKDLKQDMNDLKKQVSTCKESQAEGHKNPSLTPTLDERTPARLDPRPPTMEPADWWYAVGKGKNGASGVFPSWAEASSLVLGISRAVIQKFRDYDKAVTFVRACHIPEDLTSAPEVPEDPFGPIPSWYAVAKGKHGICNIFQSWEEASEFVLGVPGALVQKFKTKGEALAFLESNQQGGTGKRTQSAPAPTPPVRSEDEAATNINPSDLRQSSDAENYRPPMVLTGPDPSTKKSDEVFGLDLGSEMDLRGALLPPELPDGVAKARVWQMRW